MMSLRTWLLWTLWASTAWAQQPPLLDAHSHYTATDARQLSPSHIIAKLDAAGVSRAVITSAPPLLVQELHSHAPQRIIPLLGAYSTDAEKARWMHDRDLPARTAALAALGGWAGIGELHLFAQDAGSPVFAELVRIAATHNLMLLIHGDPEVLDRAFEIEPAVRILWAHLGTVPEPAAVERVLQRHANKALWVDTSVRDDRIAPGGQLLPAWRQLFEAHPARFVVAVDTFSTQRWRRYGEITTQIRQWVGDLPTELQERLLWRNAEVLFEPWLSRHP